MNKEKLNEQEKQLYDISTKISPSALLEQTAEECVELAHACLKMARFLRAENTTPEKIVNLVSNLQEEAGDVMLMICFLNKLGFTDDDKTTNIAIQKLYRWGNRLKESEIDEEQRNDEREK